MEEKTCSHCGNQIEECDLCGSDFEKDKAVFCLDDGDKHICGSHKIEEGSVRKEDEKEEDEETQCYECGESYKDEDINVCEHCGGLFCDKHIDNHKC